MKNLRKIGNYFFELYEILKKKRVDAREEKDAGLCKKSWLDRERKE
jgi:hypothetical protein